MDAAERQALFAEIERVARERGWYELTATRQVRVFNEAWVIVPLIVGVLCGLGFRLSVNGLPSLTGLPAELMSFVSEGSLRSNSTLALTIVSAIVGWFIGQHRAGVTEVEEVLIDHVPAVAIEKTKERSFPLLPLRSVVVLEDRSGERIAYGAQPACFDRLTTLSPGLAYLSDRRLLDFKPLSAS